jgi:DNA-binding protein YbaB
MPISKRRPRTMTNETHHPKFNKTHFFLLTLLLLLAVSAAPAAAQSSDPDSPTKMTSNILEGETDGKAVSYYYRFTGGPGDVRVTVDGKTDGYSSPLRVELMDEDSKTLESIYVVALKEGKREVKKFRLLRQQKVIMKISTRDDPDIKLLNYKIKLEGEVGFPDGGDEPQP